MIQVSEMEGLQVEPRVYQIEGATHLARAKRGILADEMGVGKTLEGYLAWRMVGMIGPALIIARANAQVAWLLQAPMAGVQTPLVISGTRKQRDREWAEVDKLSLVTCTLETLREDAARGVTPKKWGCVIYDEYQRGIINRKNLAVLLLKGLQMFAGKFQTEYLFLLSGSPLRKGFQDLWAPLNICDNRAFSSYWGFLQTFGFMQRNEMGAWEILGLKEPDLLSRRIAPWYLRREKKDILPHLPPKTRITDKLVQMQPQQLKAYDQLMNEMLVELPNDEIVIARNHLVKLTRLRQILCTPKILDPTFPEYGGMIELLGEMLEETDDHHFVVFTPFTDAIPHIKEFLQHRVASRSIITTLQGGLSAQDVIDRTELFRESAGICICSISYAESFELTPAKWAYFNGFQYSAVDNTQAEDRLHRMTTTSPITYYYPQYQNGIDRELIFPTLDERADEIQKVYRSSRRLRELLIRSRERGIL